MLVVPFGSVSQEDLDILREGLQSILPVVNVEIAARTELPRDSFVLSRGQFLATRFLSILLKILPTSNNWRALGVTDRDLFAEGLNFVFGQASGRVSVISTFRLRTAGGAAGDQLYQLRTVKEAVHELGHTLGLQHCPDRLCVMHFSNSLSDTDIKSEHLCAVCSTAFTDRIACQE